MDGCIVVIHVIVEHIHAGQGQLIADTHEIDGIITACGAVDIQILNRQIYTCHSAIDAQTCIGGGGHTIILIPCSTVANDGNGFSGGDGDHAGCFGCKLIAALCSDRFAAHDGGCSCFRGIRRFHHFLFRLLNRNLICGLGSFFNHYLCSRFRFRRADREYQHTEHDADD